MLMIDCRGKIDGFLFTCGFWASKLESMVQPHFRALLPTEIKQVIPSQVQTAQHYGEQYEPFISSLSTSLIACKFVTSLPSFLYWRIIIRPEIMFPTRARPSGHRNVSNTPHRCSAFCTPHATLRRLGRTSCHSCQFSSCPLSQISLPVLELLDSDDTITHNTMVGIARAAREGNSVTDTDDGEEPSVRNTEIMTKYRV
jgi:hypothetical protein